MAEGQQTNAISAAFPAPPPFYKHFTIANLEHLARIQDETGQDGKPEDSVESTTQASRPPDVPAELQYLLPPEPPQSGKYTVFGESYDLSNPLPSLRSQGIEQIYPSAPASPGREASLHAPNHADKLIHITRSILLNFLELADILSKNPEHFGPKIDDLTVLFYNAHHLLNEYRPHQARETLIAMMEERISSMRTDIQDVKDMEVKVDEMLGNLGGDGEDDYNLLDDGAQQVMVKQHKKNTEARNIWNALEAIEL